QRNTVTLAGAPPNSLTRLRPPRTVNESESAKSPSYQLTPNRNCQSYFAMSKPTDAGSHLLREKSGRSRSKRVREAKLRYRIRLKKEGKVVVSIPLSHGANMLLKENAESVWKTATAL